MVGRLDTSDPGATTGSGDGRLFSYELKYIKAKDLADRLAEVFGSGGGSNQDSGGGAGIGEIRGRLRQRTTTDPPNGVPARAP